MITFFKPELPYYISDWSLDEYKRDEKVAYIFRFRVHGHGTALAISENVALQIEAFKERDSSQTFWNGHFKSALESQNPTTSVLS